MPQPRHLDPAPFYADGGPMGALLIHGFTGCVAETRPMGEYLADRGLTVRCPLLPGHGTSAQDLTRIRWRAWTTAVEAALRDLQACCPAVFVGGLSLGSLLTLWLAAHHPEIPGLILMAPAVKFKDRRAPMALGARFVMRFGSAGPADGDLGDSAAAGRIWCYDELPVWGVAEVYLLQRQVRRRLAAIRQPVLIFQGRRDASLHPQAASIAYGGVASTDKTLVWLENSGHNVLADGERETVWAQSYAWMLAHC